MKTKRIVKQRMTGAEKNQTIKTSSTQIRVLMRTMITITITKKHPKETILYSPVIILPLQENP